MDSCIHTYRFNLGGFPHSDICGSIDICSSPQLFAACRVLLRLLVPRHSPCALSNLTFFWIVPLILFVWIFAANFSLFLTLVRRIRKQNFFYVLFWILPKVSFWPQKLIFFCLKSFFLSFFLRFHSVFFLFWRFLPNGHFCPFEVHLIFCSVLLSWYLSFPE